MPEPKNYFLAIIFISCFSCLERADYNLPLFVFAYILWDHDKSAEKYQRIRFSYLFLFSTAVDSSWIVIWSLLWFQDAASIDTDSLVLHICIVTTSSFELMLKFAVLPAILKEDKEGSVRKCMGCLPRLFCIKDDK